MKCKFTDEMLEKLFHSIYIYINFELIIGLGGFNDSI